jgi:hypothetical protein
MHSVQDRAAGKSDISARLDRLEAISQAHDETVSRLRERADIAQDELGAVFTRLEALQAQLSDLDQGQLWLLGRFRAPMSYIDKVMSEEWLKRRIAAFREGAEPPPHLRPRSNGG